MYHLIIPISLGNDPLNCSKILQRRLQSICIPSLIPHICSPVPPVICTYNGQTYSEGDVWVDDPAHPCKWFTCRTTGVQQVNNTFCPPLVPRDCPRQREPGECCYTCRGGQCLADWKVLTLLVAGSWLPLLVAGGGGCLGPPLISPVLTGRFLKFKRHSFRLNMIYISKKRNFKNS